MYEETMNFILQDIMEGKEPTNAQIEFMLEQYDGLSGLYIGGSYGIGMVFEIISNDHETIVLKPIKSDSQSQNDRAESILKECGVQSKIFVGDSPIAGTVFEVLSNNHEAITLKPLGTNCLSTSKHYLDCGEIVTRQVSQDKNEITETTR